MQGLPQSIDCGCAPRGGWVRLSLQQVHPPCGAHPQSMDSGRPCCAVGRGQFPHRYKPRSVLPPAHGWNKCTGHEDLGLLTVVSTMPTGTPRLSDRLTKSGKCRMTSERLVIGYGRLILLHDLCIISAAQKDWVNNDLLLKMEWICSYFAEGIFSHIRFHICCNHIWFPCSNLNLPPSLQIYLQI